MFAFAENTNVGRSAGKVLSQRCRRTLRRRGDDLAFNPHYLLDGLNAIESDTAVLSFTAPIPVPRAWLYRHTVR